MRRTGKTTRAVDEAIQHLFINGKLFLPKHILPFGKYKNEIPFYDPDTDYKNKAQIDFVKIIERRILFEHGTEYIEKEEKPDYIIFRIKP